MRSRYAAYARGLVDYIIATTHPEGPHAESDRDQWARGVVAFAETHRFVSLSVLDHSTAGDEAWVTFRAGLLRAGQDVSFTERSRFQRVDGRWLYREGTPV